MLICCMRSVQTKVINWCLYYYQFITHSSLCGRPTKPWSGRECGESWAVWLALPRLPSGRRVAIPSNPHFRYLSPILHSMFIVGFEIAVESVNSWQSCYSMLKSGWISNKPVSSSGCVNDTIFVFQHSMVIDTRNSSILPKKGGLLKIHQVCCLVLSHGFSSNAIWKQYDTTCTPGWRFVLWLCRNLLVTLGETPVSWRRTLRSSSTKHSSGTQWDYTCCISAI